MEENLVSKRAYSPPQLSRSQARVFSELVWESSGEEEPFRRLRPFFLVYRMQEFTPLAVRLKFEGDKEYRDWQAVGAVPALHSDELREEASHGWILLGYVPPAVRFEAKLMCRDRQGRHGAAIAQNLVADENKTFDLAYFEVPQPASSSANQNPSPSADARVAAKH
jgi:hypothetical protein